MGQSIQNPNRTNLLTPLEASEWLKIPVKTLAQWRWLGIGPPYVKLGGTVRYRESDMEIWLEENTRKSGMGQ